MDRIAALLSIARRRLGLDALLNGAVVAAAAMAGLALLAALATRVSPTVVIPWLPVGIGMAVVVAVWGAVALRRSRRSMLETALMIDERLGLKERLSTAVCCADREDPFALAAIEDAVVLSRDAGLSSRVRRAFPVKAPGSWWAAPLLVALAFFATFLPQGDLFARNEPKADDLEAVRQDAQAAMQELVKQVKEDPGLSAEMSEMLADMQSHEFDDAALKTPEDIRREAIKQATELSQRLDEMLNGEQAMVDAALKEAMRNLQSPESGPAKELSQAMARGDFNAARQALKQILEDAQAGNLPPEKLEELANQLDDLAKQMEKLAEQRQALENALRQAGLDPQLANNPQALQQAVQNNPNLNQQQKQQLQQMAQAQQQAQQMMQQMGQAMAGMCQAMQAGDGQQMGQMGQMGDQMLGQAEMLRQMMMQAQAAMQVCQGQCQGMGQGLAQMPGGGMGQRGQGAGGKAPISPTPFATKLEKEKAEIVGGEIIARQLVDGAPVTGESRARLERVVGDLSKGQEAGTQEEQIPPYLQAVHKYYFGRLQKRIEQAPSEPAAGNGKG